MSTPALIALPGPRAAAARVPSLGPSLSTLNPALLFPLITSCRRLRSKDGILNAFAFLEGMFETSTGGYPGQVTDTGLCLKIKWFKWKDKASMGNG